MAKTGRPREGGVDLTVMEALLVAILRRFELVDVYIKSC